MFESARSADKSPPEEEKNTLYKHHISNELEQYVLQTAIKLVALLQQQTNKFPVGTHTHIYLVLLAQDIE